MNMAKLASQEESSDGMERKRVDGRKDNQLP